LADRLTGRASPRFIAVEPLSCPSLTRGRFAYDFGDTAHLTPLVKMYTLGCEYMPHPNHAGGLRYHGMNPVLSQLYHDGILEARAVGQRSVFEAATLFAAHETILPAPESSHAVRAAIDEALRCREAGERKTILFGLSGTGYFDMTAYGSYLDGTMTDHRPTDEDLAPAFAALPKVE
jgi:tryptophan synthase beta chain